MPSFGSGTLFVPTDTGGSPNALLDAATGAVIANPPLPITHENGAQWLDGTFALDESVSGDLVIFAPDFTLLATVARPSGTNCISSDLSTRFYAQTRTGTRVVTAYTRTGTVVDTWSPTPLLTVFAITPDNSKMFYTSGDRRTLGVYDLVARADLGALTTLPPAATSFDDLLYVPTTPPSLLLIVSDDINADPAIFHVYRYGLDGTLLQSYPLPNDSEWNDDPRLALNNIQPTTSFWTHAFPKASPDPDVPHSIVRQTNLTTGATMLEYSLDDPTVVPFSCPFFAMGLPASKRPGCQGFGPLGG